MTLIVVSNCIPLYTGTDNLSNICKMFSSFFLKLIYLYRTRLHASRWETLGAAFSTALVSS